MRLPSSNANGRRSFPLMSYHSPWTDQRVVKETPTSNFSVGRNQRVIRECIEELVEREMTTKQSGNADPLSIVIPLIKSFTETVKLP